MTTAVFLFHLFCTSYTEICHSDSFTCCMWKERSDSAASCQQINQHMGGVDLADQLASYYPMGRSSVKWWRYVCWWLLQTAMVNAFTVFRETKNAGASGSRRRQRHLDFRMDVLRSLSKGQVARSKQPSESVSQAGVTAANPMTHVMSKIGTKADCVQCKEEHHQTPKKLECPHCQRLPGV